MVQDVQAQGPGGLGLISTKRMNIALMTKWLWRIASGDGGLWLTIIQNKYLWGRPLAFGPRTGGSQFWQSIIQLLPVLRLGSSITVGTGSATLFWLDRWCGPQSFARRFQALFVICTVPDISVETALGHLEGLMLGHISP